MSELFLKWLEQTPEALVRFLAVAQQFYADQAAVDLPPGHADGPREFHAGEPVALKTVGLTDAQIDALNRGMAEAWVKEKAIEFIKGFVMGVMAAA